MVGLVVGAVAAVVVIVLAYRDRTKLAAEAKAAVAKAENVESAVKAKIKQEVDRVVGDAKAEAARVVEAAQTDVANIKNGVTGLVEKVEADLKKVL